MGSEEMIKMFRLNSDESEKLREIAIEVNKKRIEKGVEPVKDSELMHEILDEAFRKATITKSGRVSLNI